MTRTLTIIALGGSNSSSSINKQLAVYTANQVADAAVKVIDLNDYPLPLYGPDLEKKEGIHKNASVLRDIITAADGIVLSLAEYNGSYSSAFKNMFDWLSRIDMKVWQNKPMLLLATSPGQRGGMGVLGAAKQSFPHLGGNIVADFSLPSFHENFQDAAISNEEKATELAEKVQQFHTALTESST